MDIIELEDQQGDTLKAFEDSEYPLVDKEHFGNQLPNFNNSSHTLVMKDGDSIAGYITIDIKLGIAYINSLLIGKNYRRKGIGKQLVAKAEAKARSLGAHKIWLETGRGWDAKQFYEALGYMVRTILPDDAGHQDFVLMDKML